MQQSFISATIMLILITDPLGNIPLFIAALKKVKPERRRLIIFRECGIAFAVLLVFMLFGGQILNLLHLNEDSLKVAGGVILLLIAINMVFPGSGARLDSGGVSTGSSEGNPAEISDEPFIVPVAIPLISGPSAMVAAILIGGAAPERMLEWVAALAVTILVSLIVFLLSEKIEKALGARTTKAVEKLMGLVLTAISVDMLLSGVARYIRSLG